MVGAVFRTVFFVQVVLDCVDQGSQDAGGGLTLPGRPAGYQVAEAGRQVYLEAVDDRLTAGTEFEHRDAAVAGVGSPVSQAAPGHPVQQAADVGPVAVQHFGDLTQPGLAPGGGAEQLRLLRGEPNLAALPAVQRLHGQHEPDQPGSYRARGVSGLCLLLSHAVSLPR